ncbi:hypothetical protein BRC92_08340 [Halobacteriales archaeon QS_4_69_31]|nr:MAG: hypothetical protein BRC92_08340 [Halobacteriales archaeon QS_4_69_31]
MANEKSYTDTLSLGREATRRWPVTLLVLIGAGFGGAAVAADIAGFPSIAGILVAYLIVLVVLTVLFAILPVFALDFFD